MVTADELMKDQNERRKNTEKTYKKIYKLIEKRIVECNNINMCNCKYELPLFVSNLPMYSRDECKISVKNKLISNGFKVVDITNSVILITWG